MICPAAETFARDLRAFVKTNGAAVHLALHAAFRAARRGLAKVSRSTPARELMPQLRAAGQEIAGTDDSIGQYESYEVFTIRTNDTRDQPMRRRPSMQMKATAATALCCAALMTATPASAWCIKVPEANLRQGAGTNYEKSWEVFKYMPLRKIGQKGSWYHVQDVDGDVHWVYSNLVTNSMSCAIVKVQEANVRKGPGTDYEASPLSPVEKYYSFKVIETRGDWARVEDAALNEGWVYKPLLWIQ